MNIPLHKSSRVHNVHAHMFCVCDAVWHGVGVHCGGFPLTNIKPYRRKKADLRGIEMLAKDKGNDHPGKRTVADSTQGLGRRRKRERG